MPLPFIHPMPMCSNVPCFCYAWLLYFSSPKCITEDTPAEPYFLHHVSSLICSCSLTSNFGCKYTIYHTPGKDFHDLSLRIKHKNTNTATWLGGGGGDHCGFLIKVSVSFSRNFKARLITQKIKVRSTVKYSNIVPATVQYGWERGQYCLWNPEFLRGKQVSFWKSILRSV